MPALLAPLAADKVDAWRAFAAELSGPRAADLAEMNARHGLDDHRAYLQALPDGGHAVIVVVEGPGSGSWPASALGSDHPFDQWFAGSIASLHGFGPDTAPPPLAERLI